MNENAIYNYGQGAVGSCPPTEYRAPSLTEQMIMRKAQLESQLAEVNTVLAGLEKNPEAAELFNAISRLGGLR
jgi:hypothetical protein